MSVSDTIRAARLSLLGTIAAAVIGLGGVAATVTTTLIDDPPPESCTALIARVDKLSPEAKAVYAKPGPPPAGVPRLASDEEIARCHGDPEALLEAE